MTVLITGAGLVGAQIARLEQDAGRRPVLFDVAPRLDALSDHVDLQRCDVVRGDLLNSLDIVDAITEHRVTRIIHTAAHPGLTPGGQDDPLNAVRINILGTAHVLEAARILGLDRVVACSSSVLHVSLAGGEDNGAPGMENAYPRTTSIYATTKQALENLAGNYNALGLDVVCVRFSAVFGPWAPGGGGPATSAMGDWLTALAAGQDVPILPMRTEWLYSKDAGRGAWLACWAENLEDRVFNIGSGVSHDSHELVADFQRLVPGAEVRVSADGAGLGAELQRAMEVSGAVSTGSSTALTDPMSLDRARRQLGYEPQFPLPAALADYYAWITARERL